MGNYWDMFIDKYGKYLADISLRSILELFWRYCNGEEKAIDKFIHKIVDVE